MLRFILLLMLQIPLSQLLGNNISCPYLFDFQITSEDQNSLKMDWERLNEWPFFYSDLGKNELKRVLNIPKIDNQYLSNWVSTRIHYVISENFDRIGNTKSIGPIQYPFPNSFPNNLDHRYYSPIPDTAKNKVANMSNIGITIYRQGKREGALKELHFPIDHRSTLPLVISSPRIGVIRIGPGLFKNRGYISDRNSYAATVKRLATLFHEARHSDGHAKSLGFSHTYCPDGHDFAGKLACDRSLNGPYTIGANMIKLLSENCQQCTESEKEGLQLSYIDGLSRVIRNTPQYTITDPILALDIKKIKTKIYDYPKKKRFLTKKLNTLYYNAPKKTIKFIPSRNISPAPERIRL